MSTNELPPTFCVTCRGTAGWYCTDPTHEHRVATRVRTLAETTSNTEQAVARAAEQSHLVALAERDALTAQVKALTAQRDEAVRLLRVAMPAVPKPADIERWYSDRRALLRGVDQ